MQSKRKRKKEREECAVARGALNFDSEKWWSETCGFTCLKIDGVSSPSLVRSMRSLLMKCFQEAVFNSVSLFFLSLSLFFPVLSSCFWTSVHCYTTLFSLQLTPCLPLVRTLLLRCWGGDRLCFLRTCDLAGFHLGATIRFSPVCPNSDTVDTFPDLWIPFD